LDDKTFGVIVIIIVAVIQLMAWYSGHNGQVFAFTSLIVGLIAGKLLGFSLNHVPPKK